MISERQIKKFQKETAKTIIDSNLDREPETIIDFIKDIVGITREYATELYNQIKSEGPLDYLIEAIEKAGVKVTFGLQPNHIERIESEINRWDAMLKDDEEMILKLGWRKFDKSFWDGLGKEFGWCPFTLALYYFEYLEDKKDAKG